jgi:AraC family transcriptional regulator
MPKASSAAKIASRRRNLAEFHFANVDMARQAPASRARTTSMQASSPSTTPRRRALRGVLPQPVASSWSCGWNSVSVELYRAASVDVVAETSDHLISVITSGSTDLLQRRERKSVQARVRPGDVIITPAGPPKLWRQKQDAEYILVRIAPAFLRRIVDNEPSASDRVELLDNFGSRDLEIERMAKRLLTECRESRYASRTYADAIATELGVHLLRNYCAPMGAVLRSARVLPVHKLRRVAEFVEDNLPDDLTLERLSDALAMSPYHFAHVFKQTTGIAPHRYVIHCRVKRAMALLRETDLPIAEVAHRVGFASPSHFSVVFHKVSGMTPRQYRTEA